MLITGALINRIDSKVDKKVAYDTSVARFPCFLPVFFVVVVVQHSSFLGCFASMI